MILVVFYFERLLLLVIAGRAMASHLPAAVSRKLAVTNDSHFDANIDVRKKHHAIMSCVHVKNTGKEGKVLENGPIFTGSDAELLSRALSEMKTKAYAESEL
jgi:hypothetical protein